MPEFAAELFLEYAGAELFDAAVSFVASYGAYLEAAAVLTSVYAVREQQRRAKSAYNDGLRDRYAMQRGATEPRALVLGRARVSGPITFMHSYGENNATLVMCVVLAAHECDGIEDIYFNDVPLILDGDGNVVGTKNVERFSINGTTATFSLGARATDGTVSAVATYDTGDVTLGVSLRGGSRGLTLDVTGGINGKIGSVRVVYQPYEIIYTPHRIEDTNIQQTASGSSGSFSIAANCITDSIAVVDVASDGTQKAIPFTVTGTTLTYSGATAGHIVHLMYQAGTTYSRARIRKYLGGAGQAADTSMIANLPGMWTSAHVGAGLCYLVVELDYDPGTFPSGVPNVSAVVRGLKCFDPRTGLTAWTDNPSILTRAYYTHPLGGGRSASEVNDTSVIAAANVCDGVVTYTVGTHSQTRARYKASTVARMDRKPQDVLTDLTHAMGGRWVISGNKLTLKAGAYSSPVASMDESWLHSGSAVSMQPRPNRSDLTNCMVGIFADEEQAWQTVAYPKVAPSAYITADGRELQTSADYPAVTYSGQAQYLSNSAIRYNRAGLTVKLSCNMRAYPLEVFDVVSLSLARFGWSAKTFEVLSTGFSVEGLVELTLNEIDSSIWAMDAAFLATDYAMKSSLPSPWMLDVPVLNAPSSGTDYLMRQGDGAVVSRIYVSWGAMTDKNIINGGFIDVAYMKVGDPVGAWNTISVAGDAPGALIPSVNDGAVYLIKARARNRLAEGDWSRQVSHFVVGKTQPPAAPDSLSANIVPGAVRISWTPCAEADYAETVLRVGASWVTGTPLPRIGPASSYDWLWPSLGNYTIWAQHVDTSGNASAAVSVAVNVTSAIYVPGSSVAAPADWINSNIGLPRGQALSVNPECNLPAEWNPSGSAAFAFVSGVVGVPYQTGVGNSAGIGGLTLISKTPTPIDPTRRLRVSAFAYSNNGTGNAYLGVAWLDKNGAAILSNVAVPSGWNNETYSYFGLVNQPPPAAGQRYVQEFGAGVSGVAIPSNAVAALLVYLPNYSGTAGARHYVTDFKIEDITDVAYAGTIANWSGVSGSGKPLDNASKVIDLGEGTDPGQRGANDPPSFYSTGVTRQFKVSAAVGLGGADNYLTLETVIQYVDGSGGSCYQYAYRGTTTWRRWGTCGANSWAGAWAQDLDRNAYTGALDATKNLRYYQESDPGAVPDHSLWITSKRSWERIGGVWRPYVGDLSITTNQLDLSAATNVLTAITPTMDQSWTSGAGSLSAGFQPVTLTYTNTTSRTVTVEATCSGSYVMSVVATSGGVMPQASGVSSYMTMQLRDASNVFVSNHGEEFRGYVGTLENGQNQTIYKTYFARVDVPPGYSVVAGMLATFQVGYNTTVSLNARDVVMNMTAVKA